MPCGIVFALLRQDKQLLHCFVVAAQVIISSGQLAQQLIIPLRGWNPHDRLHNLGEFVVLMQLIQARLQLLLHRIRCSSRFGLCYVLLLCHRYADSGLLRRLHLLNSQ
ncbi:hypothetical protein D3C73_1306090 [compost metagenome]